MKDAKPDTWMPIVIGDYKKDTDRLTRDQHGGYLLLMMAYWCTGPLLDDDEELAAIVKATPAEWRKLRPKLARFFQVVDGVWRHKRIDEELVTWGKKKVKASEKGKAGAKARWHGVGNATGMPRALLKESTSPSPREVDGPIGQSTLSGLMAFPGPSEVRAAFVDAMGEDWTASYIDRCAWQDIPDRALIPANGMAAHKIIREARRVLHELAISVLEKAS